MRNGCKITCISDTKLEFTHRHSHLKHLDSSTGLFWAASVCLSLADLNYPSLFVKVFISVLVRHVVLPWNHHVPCIWYVISSYFVFVFKNVKRIYHIGSNEVASGTTDQKNVVKRTKRYMWRTLEFIIQARMTNKLTYCINGKTWVYISCKWSKW